MSDPNPKAVFESLQGGLIRTLLDAIPDVVFFRDADGIYRGCNAALAALLGHPVEEIIGRTDDELFGRERGDILRARDRQLLTANEASRAEEWFTAPDGRSILLDTIKTPVFEPNGEVIGVFGISRDITGIRRTEEVLRASEESYRNQFIDSSAVMMLINPEDGRIIDANPAAERFYGYSRQEFQTLWIGDLNTMEPTALRRVIASVQPGKGQFFISNHRLSNGTVRTVEITVSRILHGGRRVNLAIVHDITVRRQAEDEVANLLTIQRQMTRLATEFINIPMDRHDEAINQSLAMIGGLVKVDRAYLFAYDFARGIARNTHEWCAEGIAPSIDELPEMPINCMPSGVAAHRAGEVVLIPRVADLPDGDVFREVMESQQVRSLVALPLMSGGNCLGFVGFDSVRQERDWREGEIALLRVLAELYANFESRLAAERKAEELRERLVQACDAAEAAGQAKSLFLANMSHEIRTPLNAVLGYSQIMHRECRECPNGGRLNAISRSGEHLLHLLTDLLELVRTDSHKVTLALGDFDFHQVLEDVRLMFARQQEARGLALVFSHGPEVPRFIRADAGKVRQILVNLVGNAVKFTEQGSVRVTASVQNGSGADGFVIAVEVEDTGCGIGADDAERVFEIFEQAPSGGRHRKGVGLGLPLSRRYARAMGGDVTASSRSGGGSRFRFTFHAFQAAGAGPAGNASGEARRLTASGRSPHVLVVDDEAENREMMVDLLTAVGFTVETADTAEQALDRIASAGGVNLVLMDKRLPGIDGYQAIRQLRELPDGKNLPIIVVTASGAADEHNLAHKVGADGYVAKPVQRDCLLAEIARLTGVEYEYEELPAVTEESAVLEPGALARVSSEQRDWLARALQRGDIKAMRRLIAELSVEHAGLAKHLEALVEVYDYDCLNRLLEAAKGEIL